MRNFPKRLATASDIRNCLDMVRSGYFKPSQLYNAMIKLEKQNYSECPILEKEAKTATIIHCNELEVGMKVKVSDREMKISAIENIINEETEQITQDLITFTANLPEDAEVILRPVTPTIYERLGMSKEEFDAIKEEVSA